MAVAQDFFTISTKEFSKQDATFFNAFVLFVSAEISDLTASCKDARTSFVTAFVISSIRASLVNNMLRY